MSGGGVSLNLTESMADLADGVFRLNDGDESATDGGRDGGD